MRFHRDKRSLMPKRKAHATRTAYRTSRLDEHLNNAKSKI